MVESSNATQRQLPDLNESIFSAPQWSAWSRCESSFSMLLVPHRPGILTLAEEVIADDSSGKRILALLYATEARDLSFAVSDLFSASSPFRELLGEGKCFLRYALISDPEHRAGVLFALQSWMEARRQQATGFAPPVAKDDEILADCDPADCAEPKALSRAPESTNKPKPVFPAGF